MNSRKVVITGIGAITPIGNNIKEYWDGLYNAKNGINFIDRFNISKHKTKFACALKKYKSSNFFNKKELKRLDRFSQYAIISSDEAIKDSKLDLKNENLEKIGVIWGTGIGGLESLESELFNYMKTSKFSPFFIPKIISDIAASHISIKYGFTGPNFSTVSSCASSTNAIINSFYLIKFGIVDIVISGGSEASITCSGIGGFNAIKALSERNDLTSSRPFDKDRDGFVMGEGSGTIVLEEYNHAKSRKAKIYAEFLGSGMSSDAYHIISPHPNGKGMKLVMKNTLNDSGLKVNDIDYINLHGTSTKLGDLIEVESIIEVFKDSIYDISMSSIKSMTGHLLGASGSIELIASIFSICTQIIPPSINHFKYDAFFNERLNFTFNKPQKRVVNIILSNTFGFGGRNCSIILKKF